MHVADLELHSSTLPTRFAELVAQKKREQERTGSSFESSSFERLHITEDKGVRLILSGF